MEPLQPALLVDCSSFQEIKTGLYSALSAFEHLFPEDKGAAILLKPNLNSNMNALTGNTTDLRVLAATICYLKDKGYDSIAIGEGTNSGFYRNNISVISRLRINALAEHYKVTVIDFNQSDSVEVVFEDKVKASVAKAAFKADFFINMPKLKTHAEAGMSVCLKNLVGCLVGQDNKKKIHTALSKNIINLAEQLKPDLHIVDAVIAMEGLGPSRGTPVKTHKLMVGDDPYFLDLLAARYTGFDLSSIGPLKEACHRGLVTTALFDRVNHYPMTVFKKKFAGPKPGPIASFIHNPKRQKYFLAMRNNPVCDRLFDTPLFSKLLLFTGLRQDDYSKEEMVCDNLMFHKERCKKCMACRDHCPMGISLPEAFAKEYMERCISCLYCFCVCPGEAIQFYGSLGFMKEVLRQYGPIMKNDK